MAAARDFCTCIGIGLLFGLGSPLLLWIWAFALFGPFALASILFYSLYFFSYPMSFCLHRCRSAPLHAFLFFSGEIGEANTHNVASSSVG